VLALLTFASSLQVLEFCDSALDFSPLPLIELRKADKVLEYGSLVLRRQEPAETRLCHGPSLGIGADQPMIESADQPLFLTACQEFGRSSPKRRAIRT
jgi:hypothetical protein